MATPLLTELPYQTDSARLFETIADLPWAVFLDSGRHHPAQSRYDILSAQPYARIVTRGALTEIYNDGIELSREDPFALLQNGLAADAACGGALPFCGRAIRYFGHDLGRRLRRLPPPAASAPRIPGNAARTCPWWL